MTKAVTVAELGRSAGRIRVYAMTTPPAGWLKANGALVSRTTYAVLFAAIGVQFNTGGEAADMFRLPDLRGEFARCWDDGRGIDAGRAFASSQADEIRSHSHTFGGDNYEREGGPGWMFVGGGVYSTGEAGGSETRPRNIALLACIKY